MFGKNRNERNQRRAFLRLETLEARAVPALLYANGPWVTGSGNGFGGADTSSVQSGYVTYGFTASANTFHVADDFVIPGGINGWNLSQVKVFAYQTLSPADQNTFTKLHFKIYDADPSSGGNVVFDCSGPKAVDVTNSTIFTNTYRVDGDDLKNDDRPVRRITANVCAPRRLIPGDYWLEWAAEGSAQFSPPRANVTVPWDPTDNGLKFDVASGIWTSMIDPPSQGGTGNTHDIPFEIHGRVLGGSMAPAPNEDPVVSADPGVQLPTLPTPTVRSSEPAPSDTPKIDIGSSGQRLRARPTPLADDLFADWKISD